MKRLTLSSPALLAIACWLALPLMTQAASEHFSSHRRTVTTYADSMHTQHDDRQLHLRSSDHGVVVALAKPSPLIALMTGDVIRFVDGVRVDKIQTLTDAVRHGKGSTLVFTIQRNGQIRQVNVSAKDCVQWMPPEPPPPPSPPQTAR
jgi:hypothetical protein